VVSELAVQAVLAETKVKGEVRHPAQEQQDAAPLRIG
jgi:hypothetical protein